jgi:hypothetical protein
VANWLALASYVTYPFHNMDILAEIKKIPPVTRFLCGSSLVVTGATIASIVSPYSVIFAKELVFKKFEVTYSSWI